MARVPSPSAACVSLLCLIVTAVFLLGLFAPMNNIGLIRSLPEFGRRGKTCVEWSFSKQLTNLTADHPTLVDYVRRCVLERSNLGAEAYYNLTNPDERDPSEYRFTSTFLVPSFFPNVTNGTFFEAGALDGEIFSSTLHLERELGWTGIIAEMTPLNHPLIRSKHRKALFAPVCVSPGLRPMKVLSRGGASISEQEWPRLEEYFHKDPYRGYSEFVECYPIMSMLSAANLTSLDVLFLDLEGVELQVLKTIDWTLVQIKVIVLDMLHTAEGFLATNTYLESRGYLLAKGKGGEECVVFAAGHISY